MPRPKVDVRYVRETCFNRHRAMTEAHRLAICYGKRMFVRPVHYNEPHIRGWVFFIIDSERQRWQSPE